MTDHIHRHIRVDDFRSETPYSSRVRDLSEVRVARDRLTHGPRLQRELAEALQEAKAKLAARDGSLQAGAPGNFLEVTSSDGGGLADLEWASRNIRIGAIHESESGAQVGALFVPDAAETFLSGKFAEYATESTPRGDPRHADKFAPVESIRVATLESLWTDPRPIPAGDHDDIWWECWCWADRQQNLVLTAERLGLTVSARRLSFPDLLVIPVFASRSQVTRLAQHCDAIEELRRASDTPAFFTRVVRRQQAIWTQDLADRITPPDQNSPVVCILDGGIASAHPLLSKALASGDCWSINSAWGVDDHDPHGHGTAMAGTSLYSDLTYPLADARLIELEFRLESVKFLPPPGFPSTDASMYGSITQSAVALSEISRPNAKRVFCMAVTNLDVSGERPSSWSAAIDQICSGTMTGDPVGDGDDHVRRLFVVSAGNVPDVSNPDEISDLDEYPVEDPAQAWNALCSGGFTEKTIIAPEDGLAGWTPLADAGDHSPYSRISTDWNHGRTPIKPEVVFEAGNRAINESQTEVVSGADSLSLLTTSKDFLQTPVDTIWATSAATAQAAGMASTLMARHPEYWPETIRALIVHSATWTPAMRERLAACSGKRERILQARHFGYGVPQLDRALASAENDLALVAESYIQPFKRDRTTDENGRSQLGSVTFNDVHYFTLPWPRQSLEELGGKTVQLKVTLSYFVEPSPGQAAPILPSQYQSYGLRFELKRADETAAAFGMRINQKERIGSFLRRPRRIAVGRLGPEAWPPARYIVTCGLGTLWISRREA